MLDQTATTCPAGRPLRIYVTLSDGREIELSLDILTKDQWIALAESDRETAGRYVYHAASGNCILVDSRANDCPGGAPLSVCIDATGRRDDGEPDR